EERVVAGVAFQAPALARGQAQPAQVEAVRALGHRFEGSERRAGPGGFGTGSAAVTWSGRAGQREPHPGAGRGRLEPYPPAVRLDDRPGDREAEAGAVAGARRLRAATVEGVEHPAAIGG